MAKASFVRQTHVPLISCFSEILLGVYMGGKK